MDIHDVLKLVFCGRQTMADHEDDTEKLLKNMKIPDYILMGHNPPNCSVDESPKWPVLVFINSKSGGQLGTHLLTSYRILLNPIQVFDLSEDMPDKVLHKVLSHLAKLIAQGDSMAADIRANLRIIAAGGDGTASWLLGVVGDLKLSHPPPIATVPLGTGNNLPYSFGWGKKNPGTDLDSVKSFLRKVSKAKPMNIDSWHVVMKMVISSDGPLEPIVLPHSMHSFRHVSDSDLLHEEGLQTFRGGFWNYFSLGMDAQVAYEFHHKRQEHPERFKSQLANQSTYAMIGCTQGWFCANPFHPVSRNINQLGNIKVAKHKGPWKDLKISSRIRSIVMLNLPSFSGGLNPWGNPNDEKSKKRGLTAPYVNDELIELVGFRDGWHGLALLGPNGHGTRLAQAHKVRIEFHKGDVDHTYMRMDGEPWLQPLPKGDAVTVIEITHLGQAVMLAAENCIAETLPHEAGKVYVCTEEGEHQVPTYHGGEGSAIELDQFADDGASSDSDTSSDSDSELKRKFGAADTFKSLSIDESIGS